MVVLPANSLAGKTTFFITPNEFDNLAQGLQTSACMESPALLRGKLNTQLFQMLKKELIDQVSAELSLPKQDVGTALEIMLTTMRDALTDKRRIELRGFGSFSIRSRKERSTKNPKTGAIMNIPERKTVHFTMSRSLKEPLIKAE
ncbi:MAG: bacterial nucleoid DNA-binding [Desulfobulbaceae bacterium]|jgi:integration host factor subunit beta|nr:MAG: bacterial nucleoid DNA-binding [Desulfobulbaceae bacterium]